MARPSPKEQAQTRMVGQHQAPVDMQGMDPEMGEVFQKPGGSVERKLSIPHSNQQHGFSNPLKAVGDAIHWLRTYRPPWVPPPRQRTTTDKP